LQKEKDLNSFPVRLDKIILLFASGGVSDVFPRVKIGSKFSPSLGFFCTIPRKSSQDDERYTRYDCMHVLFPSSKDEDQRYQQVHGGGRKRDDDGSFVVHLTTMMYTAAASAIRQAATNIKK